MTPSVPVESREQPSGEPLREWPSHWVTDQKLDDLHALWHDEPGNMLGKDECGWERCEFWLVAQFTLDIALAVELHHRLAAIRAERDRARDLAAHALAIEPLDDETDFAAGYNEARSDFRAVLAAHLEAELAERDARA